MKATKIIFIVIVTLVVLYTIVINIVPGIVEKSKNKITLAAPYKVTKQARELHNQLNFVADLHCDALLWDRDLSQKATYAHVDVPRMQEANVALQAFTIVSKTPRNMNYDHNSDETDNITLLSFVQGRPLSNLFSLKQRALYQVSKLEELEEDTEQNFRIIRSANNLKQFCSNRKENKGLTAGFIGVEGAHVLEGKIENVQVMYDAGVRMMAPVHFFDNELGGSAHGVNKGGLTDFGKQVVREMQQKNMIVDVSHASETLIDDVLGISTKPLIVSHTGVKATCNNVRNLSDKHIQKIANGGGLIGIALFKSAVCGTDATATVAAIDHVVKLVGIDHVALGSDFDGAITAHFDITGLPLITQELLEKGYNAEEIEKIMGGNVRDFLLANLPEN